MDMAHDMEFLHQYDLTDPYLQVLTTQLGVMAYKETQGNCITLSDCSH